MVVRYVFLVYSVFLCLQSIKCSFVSLKEQRGHEKSPLWWINFLRSPVGSHPWIYLVTSTMILYFVAVTEKPQRILSSQYFGSVPLLSSVWLWNRFNTLFPGHAPALPNQWSCGSWIHSPKGFKMLRRALRPSSRGILTLFQEFRSQLVSFYIQTIESLDWPEVLSWCDFTHLIWTLQRKQVH